MRKIKRGNNVYYIFTPEEKEIADDAISLMNFVTSKDFLMEVGQELIRIRGNEYE